MRGNCCKQKNENNKKIKLSQKLLDVKEDTSFEGPTNLGVRFPYDNINKLSHLYPI